MFDNLKNLGSLMGQAGQIKEKMAEFQAALATKTVEADSGAGAVKVVMNGKFEVLSVRIDPMMLSTLAGDAENANAADQQMVEELIAGAVNAAVAKVQNLLKEEMANVTGGLNLPGLDQLLG